MSPLNRKQTAFALLAALVAVAGPAAAKKKNQQVVTTTVTPVQYDAPARQVSYQTAGSVQYTTPTAEVRYDDVITPSPKKRGRKQPTGVLANGVYINNQPKRPKDIMRVPAEQLNAVPVTGNAPAAASAVQQAVAALSAQRAELQARVDELGRQLPKANAKKAAKITDEIGQLATQISDIDRRLAAIAAPSSDVRGNHAPEHGVSLQPATPPLPGDGCIIRYEEMPVPQQGTPSARDYTATPRAPQAGQAATRAGAVVYHVQVGLLSYPNIGAFSGLAGVREMRRPDGTFAYYVGSYESYYDAQQACDALRARTKYRDAFVIATRDGQRIAIPNRN